MVVVTMQMDFNGEVGQMVASLLLHIAQMERTRIRERQAAGIAAAKAKTTANADEELGRSELRERFRMLCEQFFADARGSGWWISEIQARRAAMALAEQAQGCLRVDISATECPSDVLGYLDSREDA